MLRRHRQIKMQLQQLLDACLFGCSFWLAWVLRSNPDLRALLSLQPIGEFQAYFWFYLMLIVAGPLVLEAQGFYERSLLSSRQTAVWPLFKGCLLTTVGLIMTLFFFRVDLARSVAVLFGIVSFVLIFFKEELVRMLWKSQFAREQFQRRFILVGTGEETARMRRELRCPGRRRLGRPRGIGPQRQIRGRTDAAPPRTFGQRRHPQRPPQLL